MRSLSIAIALALCAGPVWAHDFWLQPRTFKPMAGAADPTAIWVGHGADRERWGADLNRVVVMRSIGPAGVTDRKADLRAPPAGPDASFAFVQPGAHILQMETNLADSTLPSIRFNDYLKAEGLTPALEARARTGKTEADGREVYSRRNKAIVQVGPVTNAPWVTRPVGMSLEIVPEKNPYALKPGEALPVRVYYMGKPLVGGLVKLTNLAFDSRPVATMLSDKDGRAVFDVPMTGAWLINVIWTRPLLGNPKADFETTFSSLTFGYQ